MARERSGPVAAALLELTVGVAEAFAPGRVVITRQGLADAVAEGLARHGGPVVVVGTTVPRLSVVHLELAVADLAAGADVSFGSTYAGGAYLVAMRDPHPELLVLTPEPEDGAPLFARALAAAQAAGLEVGMLRMERELETPADADALLADPLLPASIRAALTS